MQRITRLVSGPASRGRWGARAGIAIVLMAGTLLAAQVGIAGNGRPGLHLRSTSDGVLGPGDMHEVVARTLDGERYYRASVDAQGRLTEIYERDGESRPIDAGVRSRLAVVSRLTVPPAPPLPPAPPAPPTAAEFPLPPPPPAPPAPPEISESVEFRSLLRLVAADPAVVAKLGTPVAMASDAVHGRIEIGDESAAPNGSAQVSFDMTGPKGRATVRVDSQLDKGVWSVDKIDLSGPAD